LRAQIDPVGRQELAVGLADRLQCVLAPLALGRPLELLERLPEAPGDDRGEQVLLRPEQTEDVGLGDAGAASDVLGRGTVEPVLGEHREGGVEDLLAPFLL